jgi:hypothetical protein
MAREHGIGLQPPQKTHVPPRQVIQHPPFGQPSVQPQIVYVGQPRRHFQYPIEETENPLRGMRVATPQDGVDEPVAQPSALPRIVVIARHREAGHQGMIHRGMIMAVVGGPRLIAVDFQGKAVDVDRAPPHRVIAARPQVPLDPICQGPSHHLQIVPHVGHHVQQPRLRGLARQPLRQHLLARTIPGRHPHRRIMGQPVEIVLGPIAQRQAIDPLPQQLRDPIADQVLVPWVGQLLCQRVNQPQTMIGFPQQDGSAVRGETIVTSLDLDGPIERRLEKRPFAFTHGMNLLARSRAITKRSGQRPI